MSENSYVLEMTGDKLKQLLDKLNTVILDTNEQDKDGNPIYKILVKDGGTGNKSFPLNALLLGNDSSAIANLESNSGVLFSKGAGEKPQFGTLPIEYGGTGTTNLSDLKTSFGFNNEILNVSKGGTGLSQIQSNSILVSNQKDELSTLHTENADQILITEAAGKITFKPIKNLDIFKALESTWQGKPITVNYGGTGVSSLGDLRNALNLGRDINTPVPVQQGGTGVSDFVNLNNKINSDYATSYIQPKNDSKINLLAEDNGKFLYINGDANTDVEITLPKTIGNIQDNFEIEIFKFKAKSVIISSQNEEPIYIPGEDKGVNTFKIVDNYGIVVIKSLGTAWVATGSVEI